MVAASEMIVMRELVDQIEKSLEAPDSYLLTLFAALAVPDIAGALDAEDGRATKQRYVAWFESWVRPRFADNLGAHQGLAMSEGPQNPLSGEACYLFRCSMLHQGSTQHPNSEYSRIIFVQPGSTTNVLHGNVLDDALNIDLREFCREVVAGARLWLETVQDSERFHANEEKFVRCHPGGLSPYIVGLPVVG